MPPKAKITKEMVIDAAFEVARATGAETINARTVSKKLGCSTQPVMYHFATIEELKRATYEKADDYHTEYLMHLPKAKDAVMLGIGLNYIRFAVEEPNLFRFLFQSGHAAANSLLDMINSEGLKPVLSAMQEAMAMNLKQTKEVFVTLAMFVHGYASIIANNSLEYDEGLVAAQLERAYKGAVWAAQGSVNGMKIF
ncbi:MAG: TetR/AcrR family transcriptional regulator [Bacteroidales bacterium]|nr:TetR/AcrR family transcriptional regulator [Lachnoclostridium sp.]MCM1385352.1 TetR/AcrR family transcriptional regulator [Lachnoclostridium sp.]MCM1465986.1 TetR/AcrR family transcriptional regulator [Bacteroidales bacterium]